MFDPEECSELAKDITAEVVEKVKQLHTISVNGTDANAKQELPMTATSGLPRFKFLCQATVGENNGQSLRVSSRCLWNKDTDRSATATWTNVRQPLPRSCRATPPRVHPPAHPPRVAPRRTGCTLSSFALRFTTSEARAAGH